MKLEFINEHPSGVALITVDSRGRSSSVTASGSNSYLHTDDIAKKIKVTLYCQILSIEKP